MENHIDYEGNFVIVISPEMAVAICSFLNLTTEVFFISKNMSARTENEAQRLHDFLYHLLVQHRITCDQLSRANKSSTFMEGLLHDPPPP